MPLEKRCFNDGEHFLIMRQWRMDRNDKSGVFSLEVEPRFKPPKTQQGEATTYRIDLEMELEVKRALVHCQRSFFGGFAQGRMGVADACNVFTAGAELHRHHALGDQLAGHRANNVYT